MLKILCIGLLLVSMNIHAESPPSYNPNSGVLTLPFVNSQRGTYRAELQVDLSTQPIKLTLTRVESVSAAVESNHSPHYNFDTGLLTIPQVTTPQGALSVVLQLTSDKGLFNVTRLNPYIAPRTNKVQTCTVFPIDNVWNTPINTLAVHSRSNEWINSLGVNKRLHMDFGSDVSSGGIPYNLVKGSDTLKVNPVFEASSESDTGSYPIPNNPIIEAGYDRHLLVVDTDTCHLHELYSVTVDNGWHAGSGAIWSLNTNQLRPLHWTSADAAGLPIFAGLLRYDEVASGFIGHAIRFTVPSSNSYVWPARHLTAGAYDILSDKPPFGARFRLKASYDISGFTPEQQVILKAMQTYGVINADNGSAWYIGGAPDERWNESVLKKLQVLTGGDFEAVETACMMININSAQADPAKCG